MQRKNRVLDLLSYNTNRIFYLSYQGSSIKHSSRFIIFNLRLFVEVFGFKNTGNVELLLLSGIKTLFQNVIGTSHTRYHSSSGWYYNTVTRTILSKIKSFLVLCREFIQTLCLARIRERTSSAFCFLCDFFPHGFCWMAACASWLSQLAQRVICPFFSFHFLHSLCLFQYLHLCLF